jgi:Transglutaminase-like superfamily/TgpA N-terminal domain/Domain of unknown function (DUF4129)
MQDASLKRLTSLISEPRQDDSGNRKRLQPRAVFSRVHIGLAEGWFSLFLLVTLVYSTIWSVQAAQWVDHLNILSLTTALGLLIGLLAAKQRRLPRWLVHPLAILFGLLLAFWQTAGADYGGNVGALVNGIHQWIVLALAGGTSADDSIFLFFITALGFLLAYTSAWLLYRTRSPWLMILANAVVLLINLNNIDPGYIIFLVVFLVAALLLLLRFNLYESSARWKRLGLRTSDDLGWEFMQAGAMLSIGILIVTWFLPSGYINNAAAQIWSANNNPWVGIQDAWNRMFSVTGGFNALNHGNFTDTLTLGGNPNLSNDIVFTLKSSDTTQYLQSLSFDYYNGRTWSNSATSGFNLPQGTYINVNANDLRSVQQHVAVVNAPGEQQPYLFGASEIAVSDQTAQVVQRRGDLSIIAWLRSNGKLAAGDQYNVTSYVSNADITTLETVPLPKSAPAYAYDPNHPDRVPLVTSYDPAILQTYLQLPQHLDINIKLKAQEVTAGAKTMYDMAEALQNYLSSHYNYNTNINLPPGQEGVSWFLFRSGYQGFCNYFATAMAIMARELGIPARVVVGYTNGTPDPKAHTQMVVRGSDAHAWTQVYFAGYGWVNFEPSAHFSKFQRPQHSAPGSSTVLPGGPGTTTAPGKKPLVHDPSLLGDNGVNGLSSSQTDVAGQIRQDVGIVLLGLLLLIVVGMLYFGVWWRRLYRGYGLSMQVFGRIAVLANWAGLSPRRSQTPYEYAHALAEAVPEQAVTIERLGDLYVRDRWADPDSPENPRHSGEIDEVPRIWKVLQPRLFIYLARHPHFLRWLPSKIGTFVSKRWASRRKRRLDDDLSLLE